MLLNLPAELLLRIINHVPKIGDKIQLSKTCQSLRHLLCTQAACWTQLDFSDYGTTLNTNHLLQFLRSYPIELWSCKASISPSTALNMPITMIDLSGCWNLSEDLMVALIRSLRQLSELHLNGYPLCKDKISSSLGFEYQRDHVYQVRPSHDLASMTMDLSKEPTQRLKVPFVLICSILDQLNYLHTLCIQYQDLAAQQQHGSFDFSAFCHIQHLDISSCMIDQATLQAMFRKIGPRLKTLKMLNIDLSSLSWLCLSQFGKQLTCLHVSCNDPALLFNIRHVVLHLKALQDFRLTRLRTGEIDSVVHQLNPHVLERLDLSPKMSIYPKSITRYPSTKQPGIEKATQRLQSRRGSIPTHKRHPPEAQKLIDEAEPTQSQSERIRHYATIEHDLLLSDASLHYLSQCHHLIELRLCFPKVSAQALHQLLSSLPRLEVVELRQRKEQQGDCLTGLMDSKTLKELYLFGVWISEETIERITQTESNILPSLRHLTVSGGGRIIESNLEKLLVSLQSLHTFCLGQIEGPIEWKSYVFDDRRNLTFSKDRQNQWYLA
ncbi:hypothetical protein A0J61_06928 [Choanephora cucurbitarum]|uniref:F-box domain-containing protein n=1 Tax=Choanephora cucurbitarum TaxID=101091 RepID=A0A1C7N7J8_9FUNG|nr:hypothetical protein A0J61_06928 [Choanephora cucurbitarum]